MRKRRYFTGAECELMWDRWQVNRDTLNILSLCGAETRPSFHASGSA